MANRGQRAGVAGLISMATGQQLGGDVYHWEQSTKIPTRDRPGRGSPRFAIFRRMNPGGSFAFRANGTGMACPLPINQHHCTGTLTLTYDTGKTVTLTGDLVSSELSFDAGKKVGQSSANENWDFGGVLRLTAEPTFSGWSSQQTAGTLTLADQELDEGLAKAIDPNDLTTRERRQWDVGTIADAASAEIAKLSHFLTSGATISTLKVRGGSLAKTDRGGAVVNVEYGKRDTKDDRTLPATRTTLDPNNLQSNAATAGINTGISTLTGFSLRSTQTVPLWFNGTSGSNLVITHFGLRSTVEDITFGGNFTYLDNNSLNTTAKVTVVGANSAPSYSAPTGLKVVASVVQQLTGSLGTNNQFKGVWNLATRDSSDNAQFPHVMSRRTAIAGYTDTDTQIVDAGTMSVAQQANALYVPFTAQSFMWGLSLHPLTTTKRLVIYQYRNTGIEEQISARGTKWVEARVSGGNVQVYISQNIAGGSGYRIMTFSRVRQASRKIRSFVIRRNLNSPTVPEDSSSSINGVALPNIGTVNGATFQGIPAGQCVYEGPDLTVHLGMPGITSFPMTAGWRFKSDSNGIIDGIPEGLFTRRWEVASTLTTTGWTNVSTLGAPFTDIVQPPTASFAAFVS